MRLPDAPRPPHLTDGEWEFIGPYLPIGEFGPYPERLRQQFEGVIWRFRTGGQWREMPAEFGAWPTVHNRSRQWRDAGAFEALLEGLIAEAAKRGGVDLSLVSVDSTTVRAHHDAAGMHLDPDFITALLGRSRGGQTSKVHLAADRRCRPLALIPTAGQAADSPQFIPVLEKIHVRGPVGRPCTRPGSVAGDKAYSSHRAPDQQAESLARQPPASTKRPTATSPDSTFEPR
ncbi:IS5 family transposase [Streptomyces anulatus]